MKIDLHVHTSERSECAKSKEIEMIETAISCGLDAIAITDHHRLVPAGHLAGLNEQYAPFRIYRGVEICADQEDWLVLGLEDTALERNDWNYFDLYNFVRSKGGVLVLAHPFRFHPYVSINLKNCRPDAIEMRSNNIRAENISKIQQMADDLKIPTLSNSDAHHIQSLGIYFNQFDSLDER